MTHYFLTLKPLLKSIYLCYRAARKCFNFFPGNTINVIYRRNKNLKDPISPSLFPRTIKENNYSIEKCNRRCDVCKNLLVLSTEFTCHATKRKYKVRGFLTSQRH